MWLAITGHGVDPKRIPRHEFIILSIIAAHGEKGVVQPEITRISGQDKRSVPKRTDNLAKHGYITKVHVLAKGTRTSLCTLRRYAKSQREKKAALPSIHARSTPNEIKAVIFQDGLLMYDQFFDILMAILKDCTIVTIEDCKRKLGIVTKTWEMKSLWRSMRRLEGLGLVKKVKAQIKGHASTHKWYRCIKLVREPTQRDRMIFVTMSMKEAKKQRSEVEAGDDDAEGDLDPAEPAEEDQDAEASQALAQQDNDVQEIKRHPPQWDPDRPVINLLWDIINTSGRLGATTAIIRDQGLGTFYRRPIDSILGRISDIWHISQPAHLRHFAIIRDTGQSDKYLHYVYRSHGNFQLAVDVAEAAWEVVITQPVNVNAGKSKPRAKSQKNVRETIHHEYGELNEWGFPEIKDSCFEGRNGMATLRECSKTVMVNLRPLPSRGYMPAFINGGYIRQQREASVDSDDDIAPPSSRKQPAAGDKPKRKYTRRSLNGPAPGRKKKSLLNPEGSTTQDQVGPLTNSDETHTAVSASRQDNDVTMAGAFSILDGNAEDQDSTMLGDEEGVELAPRPKRPYKRKKPTKTQLAEDPESEVEIPKPGVYINPPWGKKPRDPTIKGRPKKAMILVIVLDALKGVGLDSQEFSAKVEKAKEISDARLQLAAAEAQAKAAAEAQAKAAAEAQAKATAEAQAKATAEMEAKATAKPPSHAEEHPTAQVETEHPAPGFAIDRVPAQAFDEHMDVGVPASFQETPEKQLIAAAQVHPTVPTAPEVASRHTSSIEPPIFHMLDELPSGSSMIAPAMQLNTPTGAYPPPDAASPVTPASTTIPKKRGRPRKDPNAPPRPRKSAKKNTEDTATASAAHGPQAQQLLPAYFTSIASEPPLAGLDATPLGDRSVGAQDAVKTPAPFNPFVAMAEEYHRSYPPTPSNPAPVPFNPFVVVAQEHSRSLTTTPAPTPPTKQAPSTAPPPDHRNATGPNFAFHTPRQIFPTPIQTDRPRSSTGESEHTPGFIRPSPLRQAPVLNGSAFATQNRTASNAAALTSSTGGVNRLVHPESAAPSAGRPEREHSRQLLPRASPVASAASDQQQWSSPYQIPHGSAYATARHGGLYDQLRSAVQLDQSSYRSPYAQAPISTPEAASDATTKLEPSRGPIWGSFTPSKKRPVSKGYDSASNLAVQTAGPSPQVDMAQSPPDTQTSVLASMNSNLQKTPDKSASEQIEIADPGSETEDEPDLLYRPVTSTPQEPPRLSGTDGLQDSATKDTENGEQPSDVYEATQAPPAQEDDEMQDALPGHDDADPEDLSQAPEAPSTPKKGPGSRGLLERSHSSIEAAGSSSQPAENPAQPEIIPIVEDASTEPTITEQPPRKKGKWLGGKKQGVKLSNGGILNFNRTKLLVNIIEKCDGVFPGDFEIHRPFVGLWNKEYGAERQVDRDTIKRTIKGAIESRRVHRFAYSFKNKNGVMMTRHILTLPTISQTDPKVLETQKKVIAAWPRVYTPSQMSEYEEEVGSSWYGDKYEKDTSLRVERSNLPQWMRDMELRTAENQRKREEEKQRRLDREAKGLPRQTRPGRGRGGRGRGGVPRPVLSRPVLTGRTGRQRLAGLPRPAADPDDSPWNPLRSKYFVPSAAEADEEMEEATKPPRTRSFGEMTGLLQINNFVFHRPSHDSAIISDDDDSSCSSMFGTPFSSRTGTPVPRTPSRRGRRSSVSSLGSTDEIPGRLPTFQVQMSPSTSRRGSMVSVASSRSSSVSSFRIEKPKSQDWSFRNAGPDTYDPTWDIQDITTLTDPDVLYYDKTGTFSTEYHVVRNARLSLWVQPRAQHQQDFEDAMPRSLKEMKDSVKMKGKDRDHSRRGNQNYSKFERDVIVISHWEEQYMKKSEDLGLVVMQPHFINHTFYGDQEEAETEWAYSGLQWDNPYSQSFTPFAPPSFDETDESDAPNSFVAETGKRRRKTVGKSAPTTKRRRLKSRVDTAENSGAASTCRQKPQKVPLARGPTQDPLCVISTADTKKLLYATVVVQSLLGGLECHTSWDQIRKIFKRHERWDLTSFRNRWVWLKSRCADVIETLFDEFQQAYLLAYECGDVPAIDYDNPDDYDWEGIVAWTMQNISIKPPKDSDPYSNLPPTREELEDAFVVQEVNEWSGPPKESLFNESCLSTRRRELTQQFSFYLPLTDRPKPKGKSSHPFSQTALERAKTWVRATIVAPEEQFDRDSFGEKLKKLDDKITSRATSELISTKYFRDEQKGRTKPGRNYGVDRTFPKVFERQLLPNQLVDAVQFKARLDQAFANGAPSYPISNAAPDGYVLAILNLAQSGLVRVHSVLPVIDHTLGNPFPRLTKWGFTEGHYKTVQMDRGRLTWPITVVPTERYVFGDLLLKARGLDELPPPPLPAQGGAHDGFIPLWSDLFNRPIVQWWRRIATAIVHLVFGRPGIGVEGMKKALKDAMGEWEIELCVQWMVELGVLEEMRLTLEEGEKAHGWRLGEWWWFVLGQEHCAA